MHPAQEILSAYLDGELEPGQTASVERHALRCSACAAALDRFTGLDVALGATPVLSCDSALARVSAAHDGEVDADALRASEAHQAACAACQARVVEWTRLDAALAALPLHEPSARVDAALERFRREPARRAGRPPLHPVPVWPLRAAAAVAVAVAVLISAAQQAAPELGAPEIPLVASVQQSVLDARTGTLYVLHEQEAAVAALDAATLAPRGLIAVGGRPTALALNERVDQVLVLDAQAKTLTAIDTRSNSVVSATSVAVPGTPTSLQVDGSGKVVVASIIVETGGAGPAPTPVGATPPSGAVTVLDGTTKKVETISQLDVAPRQLVIERSGKRALLVSSQSTTIVDAATYKALDRTVGGIAAAFSGTSGDFAILSVRSGAAFVSFSGHAGVALRGVPRAITPLPDGGYAVLTESGGVGQITTLAVDGAVQATLTSPSGRDLTFDPATGSFAVIGPAGASIVALPAAAAVVASPALTAPPTVIVAPSPVTSAPAASASPSALASASPSPSPSASPGASATPSPSPSSAPVAVPSPAQASLIPTGARLLSGSTYLYEPALAGRAVRVAGDGTRIWTLDSSSRLSALHTDSGAVFHVATLPRGARISWILTSPGYVYLADPSVGTLYAVGVRTEQIAAYPMPFLPLVADAVTSPDDRLWLVADGFGLVSFDPRSHRTEVADVGGTNFSAVGVDGIGRLWLAPRGRQTVDIYDPYSGKFSEILLPHEGAITAIVVDPKAAVWVGTDTGQLFAMRNGRLETAASLGRAIERLILGPSGDVWYVSRSGGETTFGPADGSALPLHGPLGMSAPTFDALGRAWAEDAISGAFFVSLPAQPREGGR